MTITVASPQTMPIADRHATAQRAHLWLGLLLVLTCIASLAVGASGTSLWGALLKLVTGETLTLTEQVVLRDIRAPRMVMGVCVGASLAVSGAVMQGLFRNPLADPGLLGVSTGASLGAIGVIVLGASLPAGILGIAGNGLLPIAAFVGAWLSMMVLYKVSTRAGRTSVATMLLAGIALSALFGALSGVLVYLADDLQLRELTFWSLGSLSGASWIKVSVAGPIIVVSIVIACTLGRGLNGLAMGEATAHHMGLPVERVKNIAIFSVSAATGAAVAISGGIGFIGIVVPHLLRLAIGPDHRSLLINSGLLGASLLLGADMVARVIVAPAELPIGIITAVMGAPVFLWILLRKRGLVDI
ncbi:Hemin transport system permease protein HmuU [Ascidiaceihabitans donghaensis]|uniref:Hemin transport system permease protein HmuU n=1 Tax=Ascidiaceihabitans donghaensis TaxID=1510460 RepID=A0A2R8BDD2_9RHOB|nr:iron ABC transporter permease [Ascidiaceihabitans donghaensis]SPH21088.1 Hemin transport system permease protein HmuU [Ascidiaceihabitans donghaensis]